MTQNILITLGVFLSSLVLAEEHGGGSITVQAHDQTTEFEQMNRWYRYQSDRSKLISEGRLSIDLSSTGQVTFDFPMSFTGSAPGYYGISNFVDLNAAFPDVITDYNCGTRSYDTNSGYNHQGIDFFSWPFPWYKMDQDLVQVVAAEPGIITTKLDGNDDRSCSFNGSNWNAVYVTHADGSYAWYGHLKDGSLTAKSEGASVSAGEYLGVVGSSGNSTGPHLHFETYDNLNQVIEPFYIANGCNSTTQESWWANQLPYYDSKINQLITHDTAPSFVTCPGSGVTTGELTGEVSYFEGGDRVYFATYYQDQLSSQVSSYQVFMPDGSLFQSWQHNSPQPHYAASYWYWSHVLPSSPPFGRWSFVVDFEGQQEVKYFWVGDVIFADSFE